MGQRAGDYHGRPSRPSGAASKLGGVRRKGSGALRAATALELFVAGKTYTEIARRCGYATKGTAYNIVQRELDGMGKASRTQAATVMEERIRALWATYYPQALAGELDAAHYCLKLMERSARLHGTDAPKHLQVEDVSTPRVIIQAYPPEWIAATGLTPETAMLDTEIDSEPVHDVELLPDSELDAWAEAVRRQPS